MPPAITASPHLVMPSRNYCTVPTSSSQKPSPSLVPACPRRKNSHQNGLCRKFSPLTGFWRFGLEGKMGFKAEGIDAEFVFPPEDPHQALRDGRLDFMGGSAYNGVVAFPEWRGGKLLCA